MGSRSHNLLIPWIALLTVGCSNYTSTTRRAREEFYSGQYTEAAKRLEEGAHKDGLNQLLFLLDRATALHHGGDYVESNKDFTLADRLAEIKDYTSISTEAASVIGNDRIVPYKGEDFEKVLISQYLAINYLMLRKYEDALVECRRVNQKLHMMIEVGRRNYQLNPMASYLSALMFEDEREWNDSYIDYQAVHSLMPGFPYLGEDLYRLAWRNGIREDMDRWSQEFHLSGEDQRRIQQTANDPEVVLILEVGHSPEKKPNPFWHAIPKYYPREYPVAYAEVIANGQASGRSFPLYDVQARAIEDLDEKFGGMLAKRVGGAVAREVVSREIGDHTDPLIGLLVWLGLYTLQEQVDLRSWLTLPRDFQVFRTRVRGMSDVKVEVRASSQFGETVASELGVPVRLVHFEPGRRVHKIFIPIRL